MPSINLYLGEEEYVRLVHLASEEHVRASLLARKVIREWLQKQKGVK